MSYLFGVFIGLLFGACVGIIIIGVMLWHIYKEEKADPTPVDQPTEEEIAFMMERERQIRAERWGH